MSRETALEKTQQGSFGTEGEQLEWSYWDTATLAAATLVHRLFTNPLGAAGKTKADTNLTTAAQMPQGHHLEVNAIKVMYESHAAIGTAAVQNLYDLFTETTATIILGSVKDVGEWTLQELLGAATLTALTPTVASDNIPLIQPRFTGIYPLNVPIVIAALTPFECRVEHHVAVAAALADDKLKISLSGILTRLS
jgi:hypothetical protein